MKQKMLGFLLLTCSAAGVLEARTIANKTYFSTRNELQQRGREWAQSARHTRNNQQGGKFGATVDVSLFASRSTNEMGLGQYFGAAIKDNDTDALGTVKVVRDDDPNYEKTNALYANEIDHILGYSAGAAGAPMYGTLTLRPYQERSGAHVRLGWNAEALVPFLKGFRFSVDAPIVRVQNTMAATEADALASTADSTSTPLTYFTGGYAKTTPVGDVQSALTHGKISTKTLSKTAVADVRVSAAYDVVTGADCGLRFKGSLIVPTGSKSDEKYLWEPVVGNNRHLGAAIGFDANSRLWENEAKRMSIWVSGGLEYTYLFTSREKRLFGLWEHQRDSGGWTTINKRAPWRHMALGVKAGSKGGFPLANELARDAYVTPGSHFESVMGLTLCWRAFHFNLGYNVFYKQSEIVTLADAWQDDTFMFANGRDLDSLPSLDYFIQKPGKTNSGLGDAKKVVAHVSPLTCTTPDAETHTLLLSAGYNGELRKHKVNASLGASYELAANSNKALQGWALFGKVGVAF